MHQAIFFKILFFFPLVICFSCKGKKGTRISGFIERKIELDSGLGVISVTLPAGLDEYIIWPDRNNGTIERINYRFYNTEYPVVRDKGNGASSDRLDSIYQFTVQETDLAGVELSRRSCFSKIDSLRILGKIYQGTDSYTDNILREFKLINNRLFSVQILRSTGLPDSPTTLYVVGKTCLGTKRLAFIAQFRGKDTTGFFANMYKSILSIRITE